MIRVNTKTHPYNVLFGHSFIREAFTSLQDVTRTADRIFVLTDENVWAAQGERFTAAFPLAFDVFVLPGGEACKSFEQYNACQTFLLEQRATRKSLIIAFGGGAVGDLSGFVAATYMRGIPFIQVPTTILAHDSAVGGKTAINHPLGKNMIGAFYQPQAVVYDIAFLETLPEQEIRSGMTEVIKHALISDEAWLRQLLDRSIYDYSAEELSHHLQRGTQVKADIVAEDETEQSVRKYLNLGHTYGHAIEAASGYGNLSHGESVMIGLVYCLLLSERYGEITRDDTLAVYNYAVSQRYPFDAVAKFDFDTLLGYMQKDKKAEYGELQFVLLRKIGEPFVQKMDVAECRAIDEALRQLISEGSQ
ncbi:MAG: 3-dehydroquinate synthase [Caryophanon sp.]|nr:3-dehydroquinate synthase [Caryophanon sp.]